MDETYLIALRLLVERLEHKLKTQGVVSTIDGPTNCIRAAEAISQIGRATCRERVYVLV